MTRCWRYVETDPVGPTEFILRAIPNQKGSYNPSVEVPIQQSNFHPNDRRDPDGLSFCRLDFITAKSLAKKNRHGAGVYVAQILASEIFAMGLTIKPSFDLDLPGHVIIPELNFSEFKANKSKIKDIALSIARIASSRKVVYGPTRPPK